MKYSFTFDGHGINDADDPHKGRIATLQPLYKVGDVGHLLAAAPALLEALESLFDAVDSCVELTPKVMEQARAAIAKARGQS